MTPRALLAAGMAAFLGLREPAPDPDAATEDSFHASLDCIQRDMSRLFEDIQGAVVSLASDKPGPSMADIESRFETPRLLKRPVHTPPLPAALERMVQDLARPIFDGIGRAADSLGSPNDTEAGVGPPEASAAPEDDEDLQLLPNEETFNERQAREVVQLMRRSASPRLAARPRLRPMRFSDFGPTPIEPTSITASR